MEINATLVIEAVALLLAFFFALTFHEFSHALIAHWLGDDTAKKAGRLTLNPLVHIDLIGFLCLLLFRIGWAKPVPMNPENFKRPKLYQVLVGLAGPISNFILALMSLYALAYFPLSSIADTAQTFFKALFTSSAQMNAMLGVFNLFPIPPLDGSHILQVFIPERYRMTYYRFLPLSIIVLLIILVLPQTQHFLINSINAVLGLLTKLVI